MGPGTLGKQGDLVLAHGMKVDTSHNNSIDEMQNVLASICAFLHDGLELRVTVILNFSWLMPGIIPSTLLSERSHGALFKLTDHAWSEEWKIAESNVIIGSYKCYWTEQCATNKYMLVSNGKGILIVQLQPVSAGS